MEQSRSTEEIMGGGGHPSPVEHFGGAEVGEGCKGDLGEAGSLPLVGGAGGVQLELPPSQQQPGELFLAEFAGAPRQHR